MDPDSSLPWQHYMTCRSAQLWQWQQAHARQIVEETNQYGNVIYEICNEPGHFTGKEDLPNGAEVNGWQSKLIELVRETEKQLPRQHLIAGQEAISRW